VHALIAHIAVLAMCAGQRSNLVVLLMPGVGHHPIEFRL
jgi:hypothetical protein